MPGKPRQMDFYKGCLRMVWRERTLPAVMKNFIDCVTEVTGASARK